MVQNERTDRGCLCLVAQAGLQFYQFHKMFKVFIGLENGRNFLKIPVLVWLWVGFGKFISWSKKRRYLPFLSSRSEYKTVRWTHRDSQTSPGLHASSWTSKAASVTGDLVSLSSQSAKLNSQGHFYSSLWLNPIFSQSVTVVQSIPQCFSSLTPSVPSTVPVPHSTIFHLAYCYSLWSGRPASNVFLPQSILLIVARIIFPKYKPHHVTALVKHSEVFPIL